MSNMRRASAWSGSGPGDRQEGLAGGEVPDLDEGAADDVAASASEGEFDFDGFTRVEAGDGAGRLGREAEGEGVLGAAWS